jgi:hypothetical protein
MSDDVKVSKGLVFHVVATRAAQRLGIGVQSA